MNPGRYDKHYAVQMWLRRSQELRQKLADAKPVVMARVAGPAIHLFIEERKA